MISDWLCQYRYWYADHQCEIFGEDKLTHCLNGRFIRAALETNNQTLTYTYCHFISHAYFWKEVGSWKSRREFSKPKENMPTPHRKTKGRKSKRQPSCCESAVLTTKSVRYSYLNFPEQFNQVLTCVAVTSGSQLLPSSRLTLCALLSFKVDWLDTITSTSLVSRNPLMLLISVHQACIVHWVVFLRELRTKFTYKVITIYLFKRASLHQRATYTGDQYRIL